MSEIRLVAQTPLVTGYGCAVAVKPPDDAEPGDVLLVGLAVALQAAPEPLQGFCVGDIHWPNDWSLVGERTEIVFSPALQQPVVSQLLWTRLDDGRSPVEFNWPTERQYVLEAQSYRGARQLGVPIDVAPRPPLLLYGPSQAELDMADAVAVAESPMYGFLAGLDDLQRELCDWVEETFGDFDVG